MPQNEIPKKEIQGVKVTVSPVPGQPYRQKVTSNGHVFYSDVIHEKGGQDSAPDPHQLLMAALGSCTSMTLQMYAKRKGWDLRQVEINITEEKSGTVPTFLKDITIQGNLDNQQVKRLTSVAELCPVNKLLLNGVQMVSTVYHKT